MKKEIFTREEFLARTQITEANLQDWEKNKLVKPVGYTDDMPFYSQQAIEQVMQIQKLMDFGYDQDGIHKIIKKVGLPQNLNDKKESMKGGKYFTVGHLAEQIGVSPRTLKHWEDKGILVADMRSEGGFRLYSERYRYFCHLIQDLQLFGYSLDKIKMISDYFREFLLLNASLESKPAEEAKKKLESMSTEIDQLLHKMDSYKEGIQRWEDLLNKKKKEVLSLKNRNQKRLSVKKGNQNG